MIVTTPPRKKSSGGHWYSTSGRPVHTQPDGKNTTLRHARTQNLVPSVTTIIGQLEKPQLTKWKENNCIANAFSNPPRDGEEVRGYQNRIHQNLRDEQSEVLGFGTKIHKAIEDVNNGTFDSLKDPEIFPFIEPFIRWQMRRVKRVIQAEKTVVNLKHGYGGTLDLHCVLFRENRPIMIIDYKTQNIKHKVKFYPEYAYQLAAYRKCFQPVPQCMSLVINSNEPAEPIEKVWSAEEMQASWRIFKGLCRIWQDKTNHRLEKETDASENKA